MMNVCFRCGTYHADKRIDPSGPYAVCPDCGHKHPFRQLPLLVVSGASGAGKSAVCRQLMGRAGQAVLLDSDILWRPEFDTPAERYREFFELWLRVCKNISQSGRPVVLFGAGAGVPENLEPCVERRYFRGVHYLALTCSNEALVERLGRRPRWRGAGDPAFLEEQTRFNRWFQTYDGKPAIKLIDTTNFPLEETARRVRSWIDGIIVEGTS
jgi:DNA-directed RNA polymerase subunit RPC12/RpoP/predicted kinase